MLTATDIVEGAYYAPDQAACLLNDAIVLYTHKRWSTSLALGVLSLEEVGKADKLLDVARDAENTGPKTVQEIRNGLRDHLAKLRSAQKITITASWFSWGRIPDAEVSRQLDEVYRINQENAPSEAHRAKMIALYVDLLDDGYWQRPAGTTSSESYENLVKVRIEYTRCRHTFLNPASKWLKEALLRVGRGHLPQLPDILELQMEL